jgi:hypothetical protein
LNVKIFLSIAAIVSALILDQFLHVTATIWGTYRGYSDVMHGKHRILKYGMGLPWSDDVDRLLEDRYNITRTRVAGCIVSDSFIAYVRAYNTVSISSA